jgi:hypothetical protein
VPDARELAAVWGVMIGLGVAMALQPLPVLATVILLSVQRGIRKAWAFFLGELLVMLGIGAAAVAVQFGTSKESASRAASFVTLAAGLALLAAGAWFLLRTREGAAVKEPAWLAKLDQMEPWPAFLLGLILPTYVIAVAAGAHIAGVHPGTRAAVAGMVVFLVVGTSTVYTPILLAQVAPERSGPARARLRDRLVRDWPRIGAALLLLVGALLIVKAVVALT